MCLYMSCIVLLLFPHECCAGAHGYARHHTCIHEMRESMRRIEFETECDELMLCGWSDNRGGEGGMDVCDDVVRETSDACACGAGRERGRIQLETSDVGTTTCAT